MATRTDLTLVDTNVLVFSFYQDRPEHRACAALRDRAQQDDAALCIAPQNVAEFYAVVTNPRRVSAPFTASDALTEIEKLLSLPGLTLLSVPPDAVQRLADLLRRRPVTGHKVYDLQLIASMLGNGVRRIYTHNTSDFTPFAELEVLTPPEPAAAEPMSGGPDAPVA